MTSSPKPQSANFAWVLAAIHDMIEESIHISESFSYSLDAHHNHPASAVFKQAYQAFQHEESILLEGAKGISLPKIPPWEKPYEDYQHPATTLMDADYLMSESAAWRLVEKMIQVHLCFYTHLKETQTMDETLTLVSQLQKQCARL